MFGIRTQYLTCVKSDSLPVCKRHNVYFLLCQITVIESWTAESVYGNAPTVVYCRSRPAQSVYGNAPTVVYCRNRPAQSVYGNASTVVYCRSRPAQSVYGNAPTVVYCRIRPAQSLAHGNTLPATQCYVARGNVLNGMSFNRYSTGVETKRRRKSDNIRTFYL
jgi:ribosomal protein S27E